MRIAFLGNDPWSVPPLEALAAAAGIEIAVVITNPARPAGRGSALTATRVADAARRLELSLVQTQGVAAGAGHDALTASAPDAVVVVAYGELLRPETLALAPFGAVNLHFSLLPRWRGASPVQHALLAGDPVTGVTVMRMDEGLDTGPILARLEEPVRPDDDAGSLGVRLAARGGSLLAQTLLGLLAGRATPQPQEEALAASAPKLTKAQRSIDWAEAAELTARRVRAFAPDPGATARFRGDGLKVLRGAVAEGAEAPPGTILDVDERGVAVATGDGVYHLLEVAAAGRRRMPAKDWARGARLQPGERLG